MYKFNKFSLLLVLWLLMLFSITIGCTYLSEYLEQIKFFGDVWYTNTGTYGYDNSHEEWGARHIWYAILCTLLFILSLIRIIVWIIKYWDFKT